MCLRNIIIKVRYEYVVIVIFTTIVEYANYNSYNSSCALNEMSLSIGRVKIGREKRPLSHKAMEQQV